ncbi:MAG: hypothetical protein AAF242_00695, partial [Bacteroidota bacterium]
LKPLIDHPNIRSVGFLNKRHYNLKDIEVEQMLKEKGGDNYREDIWDGQWRTFRYTVFDLA